MKASLSHYCLLSWPFLLSVLARAKYCIPESACTLALTFSPAFKEAVIVLDRHLFLRSTSGLPHRRCTARPARTRAMQQVDRLVDQIARPHLRYVLVGCLITKKWSWNCHGRACRSSFPPNSRISAARAAGRRSTWQRTGSEQDRDLQL